MAALRDTALPRDIAETLNDRRPRTSRVALLSNGGSRTLEGKLLPGGGGVTLLRADNVVSGMHPGLAELGVTPTTLEAVLPTYLYRYRKGGQFADQEERIVPA